MHHIGYLAWIENDQYWHRKYGAAQARVVLAQFSGKATLLRSLTVSVFGLVWTAAAQPRSRLSSVRSSVKLRDAGAPDMATTIVLTACHRCKRTAAPVCQRLVSVLLWVEFILCPAAAAVATVSRATTPMPRMWGHHVDEVVGLYCEDGCRDSAARRRRLRRAARKLGSLGAWFGTLRARERTVLERRLAGETYGSIGKPLMAGPVNTVNRSSGRPSEPFAARRVLRACGQPRTLDSVLLAGSRMNGHPPRGERAGHSSQPDAAPHLLLIEDDAALSQVLIQTLATHLPALTVTAVSAVEQAWRTVQEGDVRLLITDLNLPGLRGWSFIQRLRERGWHRPVIVISGAPVEAGPEVCEMLQITAILRKPFEMTSLLDAIAAALNRDTQDSFQERT